MLFQLTRMTLLSPPGFAQTQTPIAAPLVEVFKKEKSDASAVTPTLVKQDAGENPYGIQAVWEQWDFVTRATLLILVTMSIQRAMASVHGLALLATVGSTAPFVGLFGTVWGIYHALVSIGLSGQASIDKVAGPVGESLIMTAIGLAVAVPAVLGYNWLVRRNKLALESVHAFGNDLHVVLLATAGK